MEDIINKLDAQIEKVNFHGVFSIFGMGDLGYQFVRNTKFFEQIKCVYDNDMGKRGTTITRGSKTIGIEQPRGEIHVKDNECILITSYADKEIAKQIIGKWISIPYLLQLMEVQEVISTKSIEACMIESTNYCNATCEFCCNGTMKREKCHMSMEIFNTIVKRLKKKKFCLKNSRYIVVENHY